MVIRVLHKLGDQRAATMLTGALVAPACMHLVAQALRDIRTDRAVPALLDAVALIGPHHPAFSDFLDTLRDYGVSRTRVRERFEAETLPQGRVSLMELLTQLPDDGTGEPDESQIRDSLIFVALDHRDDSFVWDAIWR